MTGWRADKAVIELRDEILNKLKAADPDIRKHVWYWISFEMEICEEIESQSYYSSIPDETIEYLHTDKKKFNSLKSATRRLEERLENQLIHIRKQLSRYRAREFKEQQQVIVTKDIDELGLSRGDIGTIVHIYPVGFFDNHVKLAYTRHKPCYVVEFPDLDVTETLTHFQIDEVIDELSAE